MKKKLTDKQIFDIMNWASPFDYEDDDNYPDEVKNWMKDNNVYACEIHERGGVYSYTMLVEFDVMKSLEKVGYVIINSYGSWSTLFDKSIQIINPANNEKIKPLKVFGGL